MGFVFHRCARSRKVRSWLGKPPSADEVRDRLARLLPRMWKPVELDVSPRRITAALHPFAPALRIEITADGGLELRGEAGAVGPGYCDDVIARIAPVLDEIDYVWADAPATDATRAAMLDWLAGELRAGATRIGMPEARWFVVDAPIQTAMGPRDLAWRDRVLADPRAGADAFAWWDAGPGHAARSRALLAMWHEVPWRAPFDDAERALMKRVDGELAAARAADPALALPYAEWAELVGFLGDAARAGALRAHASGPPQIGYRRFDMELALDAGWTITLPGAFVGGWRGGEQNNDRYWATDGDRVVEVTSFTTTETDSQKLLEVAPEHHPVIERFADGDRHGRAELAGDGVVHGLMVHAPHVVITTCKGDRAWALATWRSLRQ